MEVTAVPVSPLGIVAKFAAVSPATASLNTTWNRTVAAFVTGGSSCVIVNVGMVRSRV